MLTEKLSEKSSTQARTPDLEMPVGLKPGLCGAPGLALGVSQNWDWDQGCSPVKETRLELNKLDLVVSPIL